MAKDHVNLQGCPPEKYTSALTDLIDILIDHDFTVKEAQIFLQSPDILSDMMQQFMARDADVMRFAKVMPITEYVLRFFKEQYPTYSFFLECIDRGEIEEIFISALERREIYDRYKIWSRQQYMRSLSRVGFYETLQSLNFRIRHDLKNKDQGFSEASPSVPL